MDDLHDRADGQRTGIMEDAPEISAIDVFHDEEHAVPINVEVVELDYMLM